MTARGTAALASTLDLSTPLFLAPMRSDPEVGDWEYWARGWRPAVCFAGLLCAGTRMAVATRFHAPSRQRNVAGVKVAEQRDVDRAPRRRRGSSTSWSGGASWKCADRSRGFHRARRAAGCGGGRGARARRARGRGAVAGRAARIAITRRRGRGRPQRGAGDGRAARADRLRRPGDRRRPPRDRGRGRGGGVAGVRPGRRDVPAGLRPHRLGRPARRLPVRPVRARSACAAAGPVHIPVEPARRAPQHRPAGNDRVWAAW